MSNPVALVTGIGGPAGHAVSQYFQRAGISFLGADMRQVDETHHFRLLPPAYDSEFVGVLSDLLVDDRIRLLVPTVTEELPKVAEHRESIRGKHCAVFVSPPDAVRIANDKWETARALHSHGIAVPRSYCGESKDELLEMIPFPMLSKPRFGRGGRGITIHRSSEDLPKSLSIGMIYQEFLAADEYDVNLFCDPGGTVATSVVLRKTALKGGMVGNALSVERTEVRDVGELADAAVRALSLEGPIDIDIRRGLDGSARILEINARVGANVRSAEEVLAALVSNWRKMQ